MTIQVMCVSEIALEATGKRRFVVPLPRTDFSESV
jgi:hypothetical protein